MSSQDRLSCMAQTDKLNPTNSTAVPIRCYSPAPESNPIHTLKYTCSVSDPKLPFVGLPQNPRALLTLSQPKTADTNVPPCPVKLPAVTKNFSATKLKFQRASVTVSGWKVSKSIGLYYIVTHGKYKPALPFSEG